MSRIHVQVPMTVVRNSAIVEVVVDVDASRRGTAIDVGAPDDFGFADGVEVELTPAERDEAARRAEKQVSGWTLGREAPG